MTAILFVCVGFIIIYSALWLYGFAPALKYQKRKDNNALYIISIMLFSSLIYLICSAKYPGHSTDMNCFAAWSDMIFKGGIHNFYTSEAFHDYPPGYMYILYIIGAIRSLFGASGTSYVLLKIPSLICNLITGGFIYKISRKKFDCPVSALMASLFLFNPAVITNGALWGQVDTLYTLAAVIMAYLLYEKKTIRAYFAFAICIFIKPQAFIFTPLLILGIVDNVFLTGFTAEKFIKNLMFGLLAIVMIFALALPFGIGNVVNQYTQTLSQYPYLTINAFNIWAVLGKNWSKLTPVTSIVGYIFIALITIYSGYVFLKCKNRAKYFYVGAFLSFMTYMLSVKMHDRYAFPMMLFMLLAFVVSEKPKDYLMYVLMTLSQFFNTAWVLFIYEQDINKYFQSPVVRIASLINIAIMIILILNSHDYADNKFNNSPDEVKVTQKKQEVVKGDFHIQRQSAVAKLTKFDYIAIAAITAVYSVIALYNLGNMYAPETEAVINATPYTLDLGSDTDLSKISFFLSSNNLDTTRILNIEYKTADGSTAETEQLSSGSVFCWNENKISKKARYITLTATNDVGIKEIAINDGSVLPINSSDSTISAMFDEQNMIPDRPSYRNGTYFDEIYHARTAYEFIHRLPVYEWTHPPLGKVLIALGVKIFGMCPFGWRISGTIIGILMVPLIYIFAKKFFKYSWLALVTCLLFTFDFMHFAQTRIATIDVYVTFFIMLMYYFMFRYRRMSFYDTPFSKTLAPLALSGIFMGLGIASKWTGVYAGCGLAIIFFATIIHRYNEYLYAKKSPDGTTDGISHAYVIKSFKPYTIKTLIWCCIFFVIVPIIIYFCSYIPYMMTPSGNGLKTIFENAQSMLTYHGKTVLSSTHPYSSKWYQWPIMYKPIWFYSGTISDGVKEGISSFGNPAVWWMGIPAFFYLIYISITKKDRNAAFLVISYLAQFLPWVPISRVTFIYHYFPCVPFIALMIGYSILLIYEEAGLGKTEQKEIIKSKNRVICGAFTYVAVAIVLFAMFYPVLSGAQCSVSYAEAFLKWFPSWVLL